MNHLIGNLCFFAAYAVGLMVYAYEARRRGIHRMIAMEIALFGALAGFVLAVVAQVGFSWFTRAPGEPLVLGRTVIGGVLGGWLAVEFWKRKHGLRATTGPMWALGLAAGEAVGRVGCWFHACCYGRESALPWSVWQHDAMRHPTQFLLAGASLASFLVLWRMRDREDLFLWSILFWSVSRTLIEPLRESSSATPWVVPTICGVVAMGVTAALVRASKRRLMEVHEPTTSNSSA